MPLRPPAGYIRPGYDPLKVPDAPTIGTATNTEAGGAISVTFTAPTNSGGGAITTYYVVARDSSSGAQFTASGSASPITVTGLTNGNTYTARVYAVNSFGPSAYSAASGSAVPFKLAIGDAFGGGYYTGKIVQGGTTYYLVVAPKASGESSKQWKTANTAGPAATITLNNGPAASSSMNSSAYPAAQFCEGLSIGGYTDWYMPARDELELCYRNLKPTIDVNNTSTRPKSSYTYPEGNDVSGDTMGINRNSSPTGAAYTSSVPAQTSVTAFQTGNTEAFAASNYWSSSEYSSTSAWGQDFYEGPQGSNGKAGSYRVRAVRRVAV